MKRRDVIKLGALAGVGIGAPSCALPRRLGTLTGDDGAGAFNSMVDEQLGMLEKPGLLQRLVESYRKKPLSADAQAKINVHDEMFRRMLSTVLLTQGFRELPLATQLHPTVQDRMWKHSDLISNMVFEVGDMLGKLDETQRKQVQQKLRAEPELPMVLGQALDERAGRAGISRSRRVQLRTMMTQATLRLRDQHPGAVIDEYVHKVNRLRPSTADDGRTIDLAEKMTDREFWRRQRLLADDPATTPTPPGGGGSTPTTPAPISTPTVPTAPTGPTAPTAPTAPAAPPNVDPTVLRVTENAHAAAKRGDCRAVAQLGQFVKELDPDYFRNVFRTDPELRQCLQQIGVQDARHQPAPPVAPPPGAEPDAQPHHHPGTTGLRAGGWMLGIGIVVFIVSVPLVNSAGVFVFGLTAGVLLVGIGLLTLLISALIYAAND